MLADKLPEVLDFSKDLANLEPAAKVLNFSKDLISYFRYLGIIPVEFYNTFNYVRSN